jgi:filamentous hemagglutinin family protein
MRWNVSNVRKCLRATTAIVSAMSLFVAQSTAYALPQGGQVSGGTATISYGADQLNVNQSSGRALLDWQSFDIGGSEIVNFNQPSAGSVALNRIHDANPSQINGALNANGQVWLVNSQGIAFGGNAQVNVGGLLATSSDIDNSQFMNGGSLFDIPGNPLAFIRNVGRIHIADGGVAALVGPNVTNSGVVRADLGKVVLASGDVFTLDLNGDGLISIAANDAVLDQLVDNSGSITAIGGRVLLSVGTASNAVNSLINMSGSINAHDVVIDSGAKGTTLVAGMISAKGNNAGEKGGRVDVLGKNVGVLSTASIDTSGKAGGGTVRVGGDYQGKGTTPTAKRTIVQNGAKIKSNATDNGDGGKVIVWADDRTDFAGDIEAKGGINGGDGGFVETSGKMILSSTGNVDASTVWGKAGVWLLDPNNITIQTAGSDTNVTGNPNFATTNDSAIVTTGSIQSALNAGTSVTITTGTAGANSQAGNITVGNSISKTAGGDATLTLNAASDISVSSSVSISSNTNKLTVVFDSDADADGVGGIQMNSGSSITSNGGAIIMGGGGLPSTTPAFGSNFQLAGINLNGAVLSSGAGNITLNGRGDTAGSNRYGVVLQGGASLTATNGGAITINGTGGSSCCGSNNLGIYILGSSTVTAVDGTVSLTGTGGTGTGGVHYGVSLVSGTIKTTGTGALNITGLGGGGTGSGGTNFGIYIGGATVQTSNGSLTINGTGASTTGNQNIGINFDSGFVETTGSGDISITGTGGGSSTSSDNEGVKIFTSATVSSVNGNITISGTGGSGSGSQTIDGITGGNHWGVEIAAGGKVQSTGSGNIAVTGTGGSGASGSNIGVIMIDETSGSPGQILATTGTTTVTGIAGSGGAGNVGFLTDNTSNIVIGNGSTAGDLTINADSITLGTGTTFNTTGTAYVKPYTASTTIGIAGSAGTLGLTSTYLGYFNAGTLSIGRSDGSGLMRVAGVDLSARNYSLSLLNGSGNIQFDGGGTALTMITNKNFAAATSANFVTAGSGSIVTTGTGGITIDDPVTLGANLTLTSADTVTFGSTVNGGYNLSATAGTLSFASALGGTTPLSAVSLTSTNSLTLPSITAASLFARTTGAAADITVPAGKTLTASGASTAITLASGRNFVNSSGAGALSTPSGRWLVYSTNPANDTIGGLSPAFRRFSCTYGGSCPTLGSGNGLLYTTSPILTATPNAASAIYGSAAPAFSYTLSGYLGTDSASDSVTGTPNYSTTYVTGNNVGTYDITTTAGTLASSLGYAFAGATLTGGLTINPATLTVTADAGQSKTYGAANPTYTYGYSGLVNGDTSSVFTGAQARAAGENVGAYAINQGTLSAGSNYTISYTGANFTINPATLTVTADAGQSKTYGAANPTYTYGYSGLVNGDTSSVFTGAQARAAGENVGAYAINQGTLSAGSNYTISYTGANFTILPIGVQQVITSDLPSSVEQTISNNSPVFLSESSALSTGSQELPLDFLATLRPAIRSSVPIEPPIRRHLVTLTLRHAFVVLPKARFLKESTSIAVNAAHVDDNTHTSR